MPIKFTEDHRLSANSFNEVKLNDDGTIQILSELKFDNCDISTYEITEYNYTGPVKFAGFRKSNSSSEIWADEGIYAKEFIEGDIKKVTFNYPEDVKITIQNYIGNYETSGVEFVSEFERALAFNVEASDSKKVVAKLNGAELYPFVISPITDGDVVTIELENIAPNRLFVIL